MKYLDLPGGTTPGPRRSTGQSKLMTDDTNHNHGDDRRSDANSGVRPADVLAVLAVASFLAAIGLVTFFVASSLAG